MANMVQKSATGKAHHDQKSNFAQTCSLLSQYLKERGTFGGITTAFGIIGKGKGKGPETSALQATTLNLLPNLENSSEISNQMAVAASANVMKSMDLFPQFVGFGSPDSLEADHFLKSSSTTAVDSRTSQMTIFYDGQVFVIDDFPADTAKEIMDLASNKGSSKNSSDGFPSSNSAMKKVDSTSSIAALDSNDSSADNVPIARRASLHRFLAKRKDRVAARAPYQIYNPSYPTLDPRSPRSEVDCNNSWLAPGGQSSKPLDLKL